MERYCIIYAYKIATGVFTNPGNFEHTWSLKGRFIKIPTTPRKCPPNARKVRESTFTYWAARLFNSCPASVWNHQGSTLSFKTVLNAYLRRVPNQPRDINTGWMPAATNQTNHTKSNSLIHWRTYLERNVPNFQGQ